MSFPLSVKEIQEIWEKVQSEFTIYEKTYLIPITHLRSKESFEILSNLKDYVYFKTHDKYMWSEVITTTEHRKPDEFRVANNLWYLDNKPVYYKWKHATVFDISDLPEFCMNSYCPLYRDIDENGQKYYYVNEDSYDDYLREKEGKPSKIDEIIDDAMEFIEDNQSILNEKEKF